MLARRGFLKRTLVAAIAAWTASHSRSFATIGTDDRFEVVPTRRDDCSFIEGVRADLAREIANGLPPDTRRIARCPLCGDQLIVSATGSLSKISALQ